jgi:hypothetical protein
MHKRSSGRKVPVSERAVLQRLHRALAQQGQMIRRTRGTDYNDTGAYHCIDIHRNSLKASHVDPEKCSRDAGVLRPRERWADAD